MANTFGDKFREFLGYEPKSKDFAEDGYYEDESYGRETPSRDRYSDGDRYGSDHYGSDRYASDEREDRYRSYREDSYRESSYREGGYSKDAYVPTAQPTSKYVRLNLSSYKQANEIVEAVRSGDVAIFTLAGMEKGEAMRVLDFVAGAKAAIDAELKKLAGVRNYIVMPAGVNLEQAQLDRLAEEL